MPRLVFGELEIAPEEGVVRKNGEELHLTKTEFRLLVELAQNPGALRAKRCSSVCGATATSVTAGWSTSTCGACAPRSRATPPTPDTSSRCAVSATSFRGDRAGSFNVPSRRPSQPPGRSRSQGPTISSTTPAEPARSRHPHVRARRLAHVRVAGRCHVVPHATEPAAETRGGRALNEVFDNAQQASGYLKDDPLNDIDLIVDNLKSANDFIVRYLNPVDATQNEWRPSAAGEVRRQRRPAQVASGRRRWCERVDPHGRQGQQTRPHHRRAAQRSHRRAVLRTHPPRRHPGHASFAHVHPRRRRREHRRHRRVRRHMGGSPHRATARRCRGRGRSHRGWPPRHPSRAARRSRSRVAHRVVQRDGGSIARTSRTRRAFRVRSQPRVAVAIDDADRVGRGTRDAYGRVARTRAGGGRAAIERPPAVQATRRGPLGDLALRRGYGPPRTRRPQPRRVHAPSGVACEYRTRSHCL